MATLHSTETSYQGQQLLHELPSQQILEEHASQLSSEDLVDRPSVESDDFDSEDLDLDDLDDLEDELNDHDSWDNATGGICINICTSFHLSSSSLIRSASTS